MRQLQFSPLSQFICAWEIGQKKPLEVREEVLRCKGTTESVFTLVYASDLHLSKKRGERIADQLNSILNGIKPNVLLLGGDLVDSKAGLLKLEKLITLASTVCPVGAVTGNHEVAVGKPLVESTIQACGAICLEHAAMNLDHAQPIRVLGKAEQCSQRHFNILCAHYPQTFSSALQNNIPLTLAGHLHGGQFVFGKIQQRFFPGCLLYRWNGDRFEQEGSTLVVSRGAADSFPVRFNCPREVVVCKIHFSPL